MGGVGSPRRHYRRGCWAVSNHAGGRRKSGEQPDGREDGKMATPVLRLCCVGFWEAPILAGARRRIAIRVRPGRGPGPPAKNLQNRGQSSGGKGKKVPAVGRRPTTPRSP